MSTGTLWKWYGPLTLVDAKLTGTGAASGLPAIHRQAGGLFARNLTVTGHACAIQKDDKTRPETIPGPLVREWVSATVPGSGPAFLNLPVKETPEVPWDNPAELGRPHGLRGQDGRTNRRQRRPAETVGE